jgi:hypothetical protein
LVPPHGLELVQDHGASGQRAESLLTGMAASNVEGTAKTEMFHFSNLLLIPAETQPP